jgi:hypothetical protein
MQRRFHNCLSYVLLSVIKAVADELERIREEADLHIHGRTEEYPQDNRSPSGAIRDLTSYTETAITSIGFRHYTECPS